MSERLNEHALISQIKALCPTNASIMLGIDDDAAVICPSPSPQLLCKDMLMDGVHFLVQEQAPERIGRKALAVNLSDIAAMGGVAQSAYVALALPRDRCDAAFIEALYRGMGQLAQSFGVAIAGGDSNIWDGPLVISVSVLGQTHPKGPVLRSGARIGDQIFVTGPLGGSLEGHHLDFTPRLREAALLMDSYGPSSMIDLSDGLAKDLREILRQSQCGAVLHLDRLPLRRTLQENSIRKALCDGEDFELCFTLSPAEAARLEKDARFAFCTKIGRIHGEAGLFAEGPKGLELISWAGYEHGKEEA